MDQIRIVLNKKELRLAAGTTVRQLMDQNGVRKAAVWINGRQLLKAQYDTCRLQDGDQVRLLRIMAGG